MGSIQTPSSETNQADAVRDGRRPAAFVVSLPQRRPGRSPGSFVSPQLEDRVSARARDERGAITTASWTASALPNLQQEIAAHGSADS